MTNKMIHTAKQQSKTKNSVVLMDEQNYKNDEEETNKLGTKL